MTPEEIEVFISEVIEAYDEGFRMSNTTETSQDQSRDFVSSMFFCTTIVTTIGTQKYPTGRNFFSDLSSILATGKFTKFSFCSLVDFK